MRTAEEWGRLAVSLPGWRWMPGMLALWSLDEDPPMPLRLTEDASDGHNYTTNPVWSGVRSDREYNDHELDPEWCWPDPDDPATEGCLVRLLGNPRRARQALTAAGHHNDAHRLHIAFMLGEGIGPACIAAAAAIGRWPGGEG